MDCLVYRQQRWSTVLIFKERKTKSDGFNLNLASNVLAGVFCPVTVSFDLHQDRSAGREGALRRASTKLNISSQSIKCSISEADKCAANKPEPRYGL